MEWVLLAVAAGGILGGRRWWRDRSRQDGKRESREELAAVRMLADEDVTLLGEQLQRLDAEVTQLDEDARRDYQVALDAYESAQRAVPRLTSTDQVSTVNDTLAAGRFALACAQARMAHEPLPNRRTPCFFNPQHGPAAVDVAWTAGGRGTRVVPACAQDAARIERGERPLLRRVKVGGALVPYWEAGAAYLPYGENYFTEGVISLLGTPPPSDGIGHNRF